MVEDERLKRARYFCECYLHHRKFWSLLSYNLSQVDVLSFYRREYDSFTDVKEKVMVDYCDEHDLLNDIPDCFCFACAICNSRNEGARSCQKERNYIPCMFDWGRDYCFSDGADYEKLKDYYEDPDIGCEKLSELAESIANLPFDPDAFYTYVGVYPGDRMKHFKGNIYIFDGISQHTETGELYVNYHRGETNYIRPLMMFFEEVDKPEYNYHGPRFRKEDNNE